MKLIADHYLECRSSVTRFDAIIPLLPAFESPRTKSTDDFCELL